ncbi:MAG: PAS domain-containing protein [Actinobacteria bacterium]|nr:PAS domain-containing protein [Actinomycetota bacterium]MCB8998066.1 PAS domain-containing protein [Actinomycetota bacterium]MCB9413718.1 PAS domain-containing protein [Actinomycetota bacterium]HRY08642.1 ATP-binding protein [Candidatus Nanopelagicales bacterium]
MTQVREGLRPLRPAWLSVSLVVSLVVVAGLLCLATLAWLPTVVDMPTQLGGIAAWWVVVLFVALAASSDVIYVPVRHGDAWEELTFVEVVIIWGVLILQPFPALASALVGFGLVALLMRRPAVKSLFNLGSYAVSGAALMVTYLALVGDAPRFGWRSVFALLVAALVFTALNLFMLSLILLAAEEVPPREFIAEQWALSVGMAVGSVGVATVTLAVFETSPALTAFAALPAVALWYAYRASSAHAEARERSHWLVALGQAVATPGEPEEVIPRAADALRRVYGADEYAVVLHSGQRFGSHEQWQPPSLMPREARTLGAQDLPPGWTAGVAVRLEDLSGGGVLALGSKQEPAGVTRHLPWARSWSLDDTDVPGLVALTTAVGSSVRAGQTLAALTEETAKLQAVVDHATDGIAVVDATGELLLWSPAARRITGVTVPAGATPPEIVQRVVTVPSGSGVELEYERADGQSLSLHVTRVDVPGSAAPSVITIRDMTRERRAERMKADFIATVSHELRTPITPIRGYADLLKRRWDKMSEEKRAQVLDTIEERANHLTRLVDDLLIAARASTETTLSVELQDIDVVEVVQEAARAFPELDGRITIEDAPPQMVRADRTRVTQIVGNLVGNALKYTPPDTPIQISFGPGDPTEVRVTDHGPGIAADEQDRVFERFYRIEDPLTMRTGGSGLGLHISRELARAMGGDVRLNSSPGEGSTFILQLRPEGN